jgi:hypothetical protein
MEDLYVGAYLKGDKYSFLIYSEGVSKRHNRMQLPEFGELVRSAKLPFYLADGISSHFPAITGRPQRIGRIEYEIRGTNAQSVAYKPKGDYNILNGLGFSHFLEDLCLDHLENRGITHISTTEALEKPRREQLQRMDLPINQPVEIGIWRRATKRGIRQGYETWVKQKSRKLIEQFAPKTESGNGGSFLKSLLKKLSTRGTKK